MLENFPENFICLKVASFSSEMNFVGLSFGMLNQNWEKDEVVKFFNVVIAQFWAYTYTKVIQLTGITNMYIPQDLSSLPTPCPLHYNALSF